MQPHILQRRYGNQENSHILDKLLAEYTQPAFTYSSRSFTVYVQCLCAILHDDNESEKPAAKQDMTSRLLCILAVAHIIVWAVSVAI